jgi:hypothetical protein
LNGKKIEKASKIRLENEILKVSDSLNNIVHARVKSSVETREDRILGIMKRDFHTDV